MLEMRNAALPVSPTSDLDKTTITAFNQHKNRPKSIRRLPEILRHLSHPDSLHHTQYKPVPDRSIPLTTSSSSPPKPIRNAYCIAQYGISPLKTSRHHHCNHSSKVTHKTRVHTPTIDRGASPMRTPRRPHNRLCYTRRTMACCLQRILHPRLNPTTNMGCSSEDDMDGM